MTRGLRNNNPLNIRRNNTKWQGLSATQTDKSFFQFKTMAYGYRAAFKTPNLSLPHPCLQEHHSQHNSLQPPPQ